jgi:hypothetical protein
MRENPSRNESQTNQRTSKRKKKNIRTAKTLKWNKNTGSIAGPGSYFIEMEMYSTFFLPNRELQSSPKAGI